MDTKICSRCRIEKSVTEFHKRLASRDGLAANCKLCVSDYDKHYHIIRSEERVTRSTKWNLANPTKRNINIRNHAWKKQGITNTDGSFFRWEDYKVLLVLSDGCCCICGTKDPGLKDWCVDHDHNTHIARGILCDDCNRGLGGFKDDIIRLRAAIRYLGGVDQA